MSATMCRPLAMASAPTRGVRGAVAGGHEVEVRWHAGEPLPGRAVRLRTEGFENFSALVRALSAGGDRAREVAK